MSTRTYKLRTRAVAGTTAQLTAPDLSTPRRSVTPVPRDPPPYTGSRLPFSDAPPALYSEVVASRSPSPVKDNSSGLVAPSKGELDVEKPSGGAPMPETRGAPTLSSKNAKNG